MKAVTTLALLALASCATVPPAEAGPTAGLNQLAYTNGLRVRPIAIVEDSRCPINVMCVWAGRLVVRVVVNGGSWREQRDLELGQPQQIAEGKLTLAEAQPPKTAGAPVEPSAYRFTFRFYGGL